MRNSYLKLKQDGKAVLESEQLSDDGPGSSHGATAPKTPGDVNGVGSIVERGEFGLGIAHKDSRPIYKIELTKEQEAEIKDA